MVHLRSKTNGLEPMYIFSCSSIPIAAEIQIQGLGQPIRGRLFVIYQKILICSMVPLIQRITMMYSLERVMWNRD